MKPPTSASPSNGVARFTLSDELDEEDQRLAPESSTQRPHNTFELEFEGEGDENDVLLDWESYSRPRTIRCCGLECVVVAPAWWHHLTRTRRRFILAASCCLLTFLLLVGALSAAAAAKRRLGFRHPDHACAWVEWRLPTGVDPTRYNLTFQVQMQHPWQVNGLADVGIDVTHPTRCLVLHVAELVVMDARLGGVDGVPAMRRYNDELEQLTLQWQEPIPSGHAAIHLKFEYKLREKLSGFYRSTYAMADGSVGTLAVTQFEANSARYAFPCFDEPQLKAEFKVEVITAAGLKVLSNMPAAEMHRHSNQDASVLTWHFLPSPPMSTYLLAIVIGNLTSVERKVAPPNLPMPTLPGQKEAPPTSPEMRNVTVWCTPNQAKNLGFAADVAAQVLPAYETAFGVAYALPKLDLVAIPDFSAGAMENWGLITYRQTALLVSPTSSTRDRRYVAKVVAHEMAHQWFGNLVTMAWWNELWLNEGMASYFEYLGANAAQPGEGLLDFYYADGVPYAMQFDAKDAAHPMSLAPEHANSTDTIESLFDPVEYERGAAVLRMLRAWVNRGNVSAPVGEGWESERGPATDTFLAGLQRYLLRHSYNATTAPQLWDAMSDTVDVELGPLMEAWTYRKGFPVVAVSSDPKGAIWLSQAPFSLGAEHEACGADPWWVPIPYITSEAPLTPKWAELNACQSLRPLVPQLPVGGWVKVNARQYGYYRVNYTQELWTAVIAAAGQRDEATGVPILRGVDVAGLIEDSYALSEAGMLDISVFLHALSSLPNRLPADYSPWAVALDAMRAVDRLVPCRAEWRQHLLDRVLGPFMANVTAVGAPEFSFYAIFEGGYPAFAGAPATPLTACCGNPGFRLLRPMLLKAAGLFGLPKLTEEAVQLASGFTMQEIATMTGLSPDLRSTVYEVACHFAPAAQDAFDRLLSLYAVADDPDEKDRLLRALTHTSLGAELPLEFALTDAVRAQDLPAFVVGVALAGHEKSLLETWEWVKSHWYRLHERLGGDHEASRRLFQMVEKVGSQFAEEGMVTEVDKLYAAHAKEQSEPGYAERAKESIRTNVRWVERSGATVCEWIKAQGGNGGRR